MGRQSPDPTRKQAGNPPRLSFTQEDKANISQNKVKLKYYPSSNTNDA